MAVRKVQPGWWLLFEGLGSTEVWCADSYEEAVEFQPKKLGPWRGRKLIFEVTIQPHLAQNGLSQVFRHNKMEVAPGPESAEQFRERMSVQTQLVEAEKAAKRKARES